MEHIDRTIDKTNTKSPIKNAGKIVLYEEVEDIKTLYSVNDPYVTDEAKSYVFDLRDNGASIREIHNATGLSLAAIHDIVCKESGKKK